MSKILRPAILSSIPHLVILLNLVTAVALITRLLQSTFQAEIAVKQSSDELEKKRPYTKSLDSKRTVGGEVVTSNGRGSTVVLYPTSKLTPFGANKKNGARTDNNHTSTKQQQRIMPPRRAPKRNATTALQPPKESKQSRKEEESIVKPDLRASATSGVLLVFGQGDVGQLGLGEDVVEKMRPATVPIDDVIAVAAGGMHNICLKRTGEILSFGCNDEGALGRDTSEEGSETVPGAVALPGKVVQVTAGDSHSAALLDNGKVFAWGSFRDSHGTMGLTRKGNERFPIEILSGTEIAKIASGADHLVLLSKDGLVYTCGCGDQGQLGRVSVRTASRYSRQGIDPLLTPGLVTFKNSKRVVIADIWAGTYCTFAREYHKGDIYVFGLNNYHQIGLQKPVTHFRPQISNAFSGKVWKHISSGQHHTIALDHAGQVFVMGRKEYGRLGLGTDCTDATELVLVPALNSFKCVDVAAGSAQSFAVTDSGHLYAWGMGSNGQLGTGSEDDVEVPVQVKGKQLEGKLVVRVAGGGQHTAAVATTPAAKENTGVKKERTKPRGGASNEKVGVKISVAEP